MTTTQLALVIGVPLVVNTMVTLVLFVGVTTRITSLNERMTNGFAALNQRLDDLRDLWRAKLLRVEGVLDARLKRLEDQP